MQPRVPPSGTHGPSRGWYVAGAVLVVVGLSVGIALIADAVAGDDGLSVVPIHGRIPVSGDGVVGLPDGGGYTLYWEPDRPPDDGDITEPRLDVFVQEAGSGDPIPTADYDGTFTYTRGSHEGLAIRTFRVAAPTSVRVTAVAPPRVHGAVAVGEGVDLSEVGQVVLGVAAIIFLLSLAGVVIGLTAYKRHRARHPLAQPTGPGPAPPAPPAPPA